MKVVTVCVDYSDFLSLTLPRNARHFDLVVVVSTPQDHATAAVVRSVPNALLYTTGAFYEGGAAFNKGAALESAFDLLGRGDGLGWFAVIDADTAMPERIDWPELNPQCLYSPLRRMMVDLPSPPALPPDGEWSRWPLHPQRREWAGFFQLAHADAVPLLPRPWYPTDWRHAGGCDSEFQAKWPQGRKVRLPFEVLHLGPAGVNWMGRSSPGADGILPEGATERVAELRRLRRLRRPGPDCFAAEKLPPPRVGGQVCTPAQPERGYPDAADGN